MNCQLTTSLESVTDRRELSRVLLDARNELAGMVHEMTGAQTMRAYSDLTDALISRVFEMAIADAESDTPGVAAKARKQIAIAAVGGYGRQEMAPFSDVDVSFFVGPDDPDEVDAVVKRAFRALVDVLDAANLQVGYSYRRADEVDHLPLEAQTALLDARCIVGSETVFNATHTALIDSIVPIAFVTGHADGRTRMGGTPFSVEPDIKEGPGGLRDLHAARWIAEIAFGLTNGAIWKGLRANGVITDAEIRAVEAAREFISRVRTALHLLAGRGLDTLSSARHEDVAAALGFADVPSFVSTYYAHAHMLSRILRKVADAALESDLIVEPGFIARDGRLKILDKGLLSRDDSAVLRLFQHAQAYHLRFDRDTMDLVADHANALNLTSETGHCFLDLLSSPGAGSALRMMLDSGILQRIVPHFGELMFLVPPDAAHKFTVGEHSLRAVEELESLFGESDGLTGEVFSRIQNLDVLFLAVLLHDIGKLDPGGDHAKTGAREAARFAAELGMTDEDVAKVEFLVANHLRMSETARLRDLHQNKTVATFAEMVGDPQLLDMLFLLTLADSRSVGSVGWTQVQTRFLEELYERARSAIRSPEAARPDVERQRTRVRRELRFANLPADEVDEHCASMPASYILNTSPEELAAHIGHVRTVRGGSAAIDLRDGPAGQFTELTVVANDTSGLLSRIAGVLYALSIDVHAAQIFTRRASDNIAIDRLYIDFEGRQLAETKKWQLEGELAAVLDGSLTIDDLLERMRKKEFRRPEVFTVKSSETLSDHHTVVEIRTKDTPGLLYYLTRMIARQTLNIHSARIATWGHEARDAFYVTNDQGRKLTPEEVESFAESL